MKKVNFESVLKRILSTAYVTGVCGGLFVSAMKNLESSKSVSLLILQLFIIIIAGTYTGSIARRIKQKKLVKASLDNEVTDLKIAHQNSFFIALIVMVIAHFINSDMNEWNQFSAMLLTGGTFILSMVNGHIDISTYATKSLLILGIIPLLLSFVLGYSAYGNQELINTVWIFGLMGFLSFLLILSNSQLNSQLFSAKHINVTNRKKIKLFNFGIVLMFFALCVVVINFKQIIKVSGEAIKSLINATYRVLERFTNWLLNNPEVGKVVEEDDIELSGSLYYLGKSVALDVVVIIVILIVLIIVISFVVVMIKNQKLIKDKKELDEIDEFDEESAIIREKLHLHLRKKFTYTIKEFEVLEEVEEKTRYLYGFIIERLYYKKVSILKSDTPDDIMHKVFKCDDGKLLEKLGFEEFTEKYRQVRYGDKKIQFEGDMSRMAEAYERIIMSFHNEAKEANK